MKLHDTEVQKKELTGTNIHLFLIICSMLCNRLSMKLQSAKQNSKQNYSNMIHYKQQERFLGKEQKTSLWPKAKGTKKFLHRGESQVSLMRKGKSELWSKEQKGPAIHRGQLGLYMSVIEIGSLQLILKSGSGVARPRWQVIDWVEQGHGEGDCLQGFPRIDVILEFAITDSNIKNKLFFPLAGKANWRSGNLPSPAVTWQPYAGAFL